MTDTTPLPEPLKQPIRQLPGAKINSSPYRDEVATLLLQRKGYAQAMRYLESQGMKVDYMTVKHFEENYVSLLDQEVRDELLKKAREKEAKRNSGIITQAVHAHISRVDSLIRLIEETEEMKAQLQCEGQTAYIRQSVGECLDRIRYFREQLEKARVESEVELEREKAIEQVALTALEYLKGKPEDAERFIKQVESIKNRTTFNL